jgi:hypothetical protein
VDIKKLTEQYQKASEYWRKNRTNFPDVAASYEEAATALSTLQVENEKLRSELEQVKRALAMMWFAYVNSDKEYPHSYETDALEEAERILGPWKECMPKYLRSGQEED